MNKPTLLPSRDAVTNHQVGTVLHIAQTMLQFLAQPDIDPVNPHKGSAALDGGARASCETTLIHACNRLDSILTDNGRWTMELHRLLEAQMVKMLSEQIAFLQAQTAVSLALNTPTNLHKPTIINAGGGEWVAILGDPEHPACLGVGKSPQEACLDFDKSFAGIVTESQLQRFKERPDKPKEPDTPEPKPKRKKKK